LVEVVEVEVFVQTVPPEGAVVQLCPVVVLVVPVVVVTAELLVVVAVLLAVEELVVVAVDVDVVVLVEVVVPVGPTEPLLPLGPVDCEPWHWRSALSWIALKPSISWLWSRPLIVEGMVSKSERAFVICCSVSEH